MNPVAAPSIGEGFLNARAAECSCTRPLFGGFLVQFQGDEYLPIGFFLARTAAGRDLFYILRPARRGSPAWDPGSHWPVEALHIARSQ
jgi:hypothetical protein